MDWSGVDELLLENAWFWMGEMLQTILSASAAVANAGILLEFTLSRPVVSVLPRDVRYLHCNKALCSLLISVSTLVKCLLTFSGVPTIALSYYTRTLGGGHRRVYYFDGCHYQVGLATAASVSLVSTILAASLQRLLAAFAASPITKMVRKRKKQRVSAVLFVIVSWLMGLATALSVVLIMPPRTEHWHHCNAIYVLPRSTVIAAVILVPVVTLVSVLMQVAAWLSTKRADGDGTSRREKMEEENELRDSNDNAVEKSSGVYTETSLTEMNLPSVLLFAGCWSVITLFLAYERLIPSFNPQSYLFNIHQASSYYHHTNINDKSAPPVKTFILAQFFVYIPLLIEIMLDPLFVYWKRPSKSQYSMYSPSVTSEGEEVREPLLDKVKVINAHVNGDEEKEKEVLSDIEEKTSELHMAPLASQDDEEEGRV